jgi:hypothetical protein
MATQNELDMLGVNDQDMEMEGMIAEAEDVDEQEFAAMAPRGNFTAKAMNNLVAAANRLLPAFEQTPDYPTFNEDVQVFPTDFVRVLGMFQGAVNSAVDAGAIDEQFDFEMEDIVDDQSINLLAGKITNLANNREFKNFLKNPPMEEEVEEATVEEEIPMASDEEMNKMFMDRM